MKSEFVPYELALRMKALGFDEPCMAAFEDNGKLFIYWNDLASKDELFCSQKVCEKLDYECLAPTWQSAFRWFREKYKFHASVVHMNKKNAFYITVYGEEKIEFYFDTYEEAELACLIKLIEIVESKTK
jgi:hypothetical protein